MNAQEMAANARTYLGYGYLPPKDLPVWMPTACGAQEGVFDHSLRGAVALLDELFDRLTAKVAPPYIVPISGGWDSRLILAALRERTDKIVAVTFGDPGQLDYEIGARVADVAQVNHVALRLSQTMVDWNVLKDSAYAAPWTYMPDAFFNSAAYERGRRSAGPGASAWSGFLGDPLTGGHYREGTERESPAKANEWFAQSQRRVDPQYIGSPEVPTPHLPAPSDWHAPCGEREWLDFSVRQRGCIAPIVLGCPWQDWRSEQGVGWAGLPMVTPFANVEWASYWLHAPRHLHKGQWLYRQMAEARFPTLFGLPSKYTWGVAKHQRALQRTLRLQHGIRNRIHRRFPSLPIRSRVMDNYIDFQRAFRQRDDYISVMEQAIAVLKQHEATPWLDLESIWDEHYRGKHDHSPALKILLGLAVNLDANGLKSP
ncbi:hypothetical protein LRB11_10075 [Ectothiorhodospira haloalkaliphila]|uniref:hypothetical protein n=1 Tax=Ectothiorhodospira haloalkaliphila TaxID=421628 RepID=UPI001EE7A833|nr:hypothetical protein [Ectothiorhodospira haloalkaliphila]MCG5525275.1 hypothetical protein [Ectothiorhodospira haloalkaliphila]